MQMLDRVNRSIAVPLMAIPSFSTTIYAENDNDAHRRIQV